MPASGMVTDPDSRVSVSSSHTRMFCRCSSGTPSMRVMISTGNRAEKSATTSNPAGSHWSR